MKLSTEQLRMPDVTLVMTEEQHSRLPWDIRETLRLHDGYYDKRGRMVFVIPGYLYQMWEERELGSE